MENKAKEINRKHLQGKGCQLERLPVFNKFQLNLQPGGYAVGLPSYCSYFLNRFLSIFLSFFFIYLFLTIDIVSATLVSCSAN